MSDSSVQPAAMVSDTAPELTLQQMQTQAKRLLTQMDQSARTVKRQLALARESRDVVKVLCLSDKLTQIDVATAAARDRSSTLDSIASKGSDTKNGGYEFTLVQVLHDRVRTLVQESSQCVGEEAGFLGESKVIVRIDNALPSQDTTQIPQDTTNVVIQMPLPASPNR